MLSAEIEQGIEDGVWELSSGRVGEIWRGQNRNLISDAEIRFLALPFNWRRLATTNYGFGAGKENAAVVSNSTTL